MKFDIEKIREIYGDNIILDMREVKDLIVQNMNYLLSRGYKDIEEAFERNPYLFLEEEDIFQKKIDKLIEVLGVDYVEILSQDSSLWSVIEDGE